MFSYLKEIWTGFKEKRRLHCKILSVILLLAVIAMQAFIIFELVDILRFAFSYEYSNWYGSNIDPIRNIREEPVWITDVDFFWFGVLFEFVFIFDREKIYWFSGLVLRKAPSGIPGESFLNHTDSYFSR